MAAKEVKMIDVVKMVRLRGHTVQYTKRNDGSIRITRIDGVSFRGSTGNARAREIAGVTLSEARTRQLKTIQTKKGQWGHKKLAPLPEDVIKKIKRVQGVWKRHRVKKDGKPGKRGARYVLEHSGKEEAISALEEQERYGRGLAYSKNVEALISYINDEILPKANAQDAVWLNKLTSYLTAKSAYILEADILPFYMAIYDFRDGKLSAQSLYHEITALVDIRAKHMK